MRRIEEKELFLRPQYLPYLSLDTSLSSHRDSLSSHRDSLSSHRTILSSHRDSLSHTQD